jgi:hypothetical protein
MGLMVMLDIVQSHAAPNEGSGLASFDGANDCYFYTGDKLDNTLALSLMRGGCIGVITFCRWRTAHEAV